MTKTLLATFDGEVLRPAEKLPLDPNTQVRITVELPGEPENNLSFLDTALALNLEGPADWSEHVDDYLYGRRELPHD
jgi:hypothetical protein